MEGEHFDYDKPKKEAKMNRNERILQIQKEIEAGNKDNATELAELLRAQAIEQGSEMGDKRIADGVEGEK